MRGLTRLLRYRLLVPILRRREPPVIPARGVMVGVICALNPFVGAQMLIVSAVWAIQRILAPDWKFSVVAALAWTWITNVLTLPFFYYVFLVTGRLMLGQWDQLLGFETFRVELQTILDGQEAGLSKIWNVTEALITLWGIPMFIGSVPWAVLGGWLGYSWSLRFIARYRRRARARFLHRSRRMRNPVGRVGNETA